MNPDESRESKRKQEEARAGNSKQEKVRESRRQQEKARETSKNGAKIAPKPFKIERKSNQNLVQKLPRALWSVRKSFSHLDGAPRAFKKSSKNAQERPREPPVRPKPLPNGAQNPPKTDCWGIFCSLFSYSKFASFFCRCLCNFYAIFKSSNL